ncbi:MAG: transcription antitermination factor NusB [Lachnospiraceae bacterium]|jgi:N utilization substance protein B|nr:transcription antitermination factor NusB [Lachnospiraceae bacterium]
MTRREIREETFKLVFQKEFYNAEELPEQMTLFLGENPEASEEEKEQMDARVKAIIEKLPEIDAIIDGVAEGWKTNRMGKVELAIIRLATYEIKFEDLAAGIAINEAVEMAKRYGGDNSGAFVNGILAKVV